MKRFDSKEQEDSYIQKCKQETELRFRESAKFESEMDEHLYEVRLKRHFETLIKARKSQIYVTWVLKTKENKHKSNDYIRRLIQEIREFQVGL